MKVGIFDGSPDPKGCKPCKEERDRIVMMEATEAWSPALAAYADVHRCPECGHTVLRGDVGGEVGLTNPDGERW